MVRWLWSLVAVILLAGPVAAQENHEYWRARQVAIDCGRPLVVIFSASWCRYCLEQYADMIEVDPLQAMVDCEIVYVDVTKDAELAKQFPGVQLRNTKNYGPTLFPETGMLPTTFIYYPDQNGGWLKKDVRSGKRTSAEIAGVILRRLRLHDKSNPIPDVKSTGQSCRIVNGEWVCD